MESTHPGVEEKRLLSIIPPFKSNPLTTWTRLSVSLSCVSHTRGSTVWRGCRPGTGRYTAHPERTTKTWADYLTYILIRVAFRFGLLLKLHWWFTLYSLPPTGRIRNNGRKTACSRSSSLRIFLLCLLLFFYCFCFWCWQTNNRSILAT